MEQPIVARNEEVQELTDCYKSKFPEFMAVYGRRRVGKTYLIRNFFKSKPCAYFQLTGLKGGSLSKQLTRFASALGDSFYNSINLAQPKDWIDAFDQLTQTIANLPANKKVVLFLDELPWLATPRSGLLEALDHFWNDKWSSNPKIKLIICGSSASWIIKKVLKNTGGLHNRVTRKMRLNAFDFSQTNEFLKYIGVSLKPQQCLKVYLALGGVPFYLKLYRKNLSVDQNINRLFFRKDAELLNEFDEVFDSLFNSAEQYKMLIKEIAKKHSGVARTTLDEVGDHSTGGLLSERLEDLENAGFIASYLNHGADRRGLTYRLCDEFCLFYLRWVQPITKRIKTGSVKDTWKGIVGTAQYYAWSGYAFEGFCYRHLDLIRKVLDMPPMAIASPWRYAPKNKEEDGAQIDLLLDREDGVITVFEIKCTAKPFVIDKSYAKELLRKIEVFKKQTKTDKEIFIVFISANGLKETMYSEELVDNCLDLSSLFQ